MKNVFFVLAFMLIGSFAFANSNENFKKTSETNLEIAVSGDLLTSDNCTFSFNHNQISNLVELVEKECTLRGKFTITYSDGTSYTFEGTLTIVGVTCAEFLKELMSE